MGAAAIVALVLAWGSTFAAIKIGLDSSPPLTFAGLRSVVGGGVMVVLALRWGGRPHLRREWVVYSLLTLLNVVVFFGLQTVSIGYLSSGMAAVLIYLQPVLVGFLAWPLLGETLSGPKVTGLLLGFSGIVAVSAGGFGNTVSPVGIALALAAAIAWAVGTVYFKRVQDRVAMLWAVAIPFLAGGTVLTALGIAVEGPAAISWSPGFVSAMLYASLVGTALAWFLWLSLVSSGEASRAAAYVFFVPLVALVIGALVLSETLSTSLLFGAALVGSGIYLVNRQTSGNRVDSSSHT